MLEMSALNFFAVANLPIVINLVGKCQLIKSNVIINKFQINLVDKCSLPH